MGRLLFEYLVLFKSCFILQDAFHKLKIHLYLFGTIPDSWDYIILAYDFTQFAETLLISPV